ncbi:hypothetical protein Tco_1390879 [Tanacetum coccineum]
MTMAQGRKASLDFVSSQQFSRFSLLMMDLHSSALSQDLLSLCFIGLENMTMAQGRKASLDFVSSQQFSRFSLLMVDLHSSALSLDLLSLRAP